MFECENLDTIQCGMNALGALPELPWALLPRLQTLDISQSRVSDLGNLPYIAPSVLPHLRVLDLSNNDLSKIPAELGSCTSLNSLNLHGIIST